MSVSWQDSGTSVLERSAIVGARCHRPGSQEVAQVNRNPASRRVRVAAIAGVLLMTACGASPATEPVADPAEPPLELPVIHIDDGTVWQDVFDALAATEKSCIRRTTDDDLLGSALERRVIVDTDTDTDEWTNLVYSCLALETARSVFLSTLIALLQEEREQMDAEELSGEETSCLHGWAADLDRDSLPSATGEGVAAVAVAYGLIGCMPEVFLAGPLGVVGMSIGHLSGQEMSCLRQLAERADALAPAAVVNDAPLAAVWRNVLGCLPSDFFARLLSALGVDRAELSGEEVSCLSDLFAVFMMAGPIPEGDEDALVALVELGLIGCLGDLTPARGSE